MHMTFDGSGGISIAASLVGDGHGRPSVLLAHGGGQTRRTWRKTMQQLAEHGYRSVAIDMRGHGESGWATPGRYRFADFGKDILAVCDKLNQRPHVIGASLGGLAALVAEGWPRMLISPAVAVTRPRTIFKVVLLPQPFGPSRP